MVFDDVVLIRTVTDESDFCRHIVPLPDMTPLGRQ